MAKGGARAHSGPLRDPNALRRDSRSDGMVSLPASGRQGPAPDWPLTRATKREIQIWEREWRRPQAVEWEHNGQELEVALYVRAVRKAEMPKAPTNAMTLVKQQQEALGLSLPGLIRNRWQIVASEGQAAEPAPSARPARERFKVVAGGQS